MTGISGIKVIIFKNFIEYLFDQTVLSNPILFISEIVKYKILTNK